MCVHPIQKARLKIIAELFQAIDKCKPVGHLEEARKEIDMEIEKLGLCNRITHRRARLIY